MITLRARNVNGLFYDGMHLLDEYGVREPSRAGEVVVAPCPVMSVYQEPRERVLFDGKRDANPFFHLMEGLWMLAGRYDAEFLNHYVRDFGERFAEPGGTIHDAYGQRWRHALGYDQLDAIVARLRANPQDRQCVLQMWDGTDKPEALAGWRGYNDLRGDWRARPCNTHAYFRVRQQQSGWIDGKTRILDPATREVVGHVPDMSSGHPIYTAVLDMTICCRSNDAIWGAHGANAVHFSMLQEYMAGRIGVVVGQLFQLSNNFHAYVDALDKIGDPTQLENHDPYDCGEVFPLAMGTNWSTWDADLTQFMEWHDDDVTDACPKFDNAWFADVAVPVARTRLMWTTGFKPSARKIAEQITAPDWRRACLEWMDRRTR